MTQPPAIPPHTSEVLSPPKSAARWGPRPRHAGFERAFKIWTRNPSTPLLSWLFHFPHAFLQFPLCSVSPTVLCCDILSHHTEVLKTFHCALLAQKSGKRRRIKPSFRFCRKSSINEAWCLVLFREKRPDCKCSYRTWTILRFLAITLPESLSSGLRWNITRDIISIHLFFVDNLTLRGCSEGELYKLLKWQRTSV